MTFTNTLKTGLRAGALALALTGTALVGAAPVQAASPSFGFSLNFGSGSPKGGIELHFGDRDYFEYCRTNGQIRAALRNRGYHDVRIVRESDRTDKVWAVARKGKSWYSMRIDRCSGKVDQIRKINRNRNGSFNLKFTF